MELMDHFNFLETGRTKLTGLKIDFSKSFYRLSDVLFSLGFLMKWFKLISQCVSTVEYNLLFNGNIASVFKPNRGILKGDQLSPYFYIISTNVLSCLILQHELHQEWKGIQLCRVAHLISNLLYVDVLFYRSIIEMF